jgi:hypothetical protein
LIDVKVTSVTWILGIISRNETPNLPVAILKLDFGIDADYHFRLVAISELPKGECREGRGWGKCTKSEIVWFPRSI